MKNSSLQNCQMRVQVLPTLPRSGSLTVEHQVVNLRGEGAIPSRSANFPAVAQLAERVALNHEVEGASPSGGTMWSSTMVVLPAVNRVVVGSSPTSTANYKGR